jgi:hypothetical protein
VYISLGDQLTFLCASLLRSSVQRFSRHAAELFASPLTLGIFAASAKELSVRSCFPILSNAERLGGSVLKGLVMGVSASKEEAATLKRLRADLAGDPIVEKVGDVSLPRREPSRKPAITSANTSWQQQPYRLTCAPAPAQCNKTHTQARKAKHTLAQTHLQPHPHPLKHTCTEHLHIQPSMRVSPHSPGCCAATIHLSLLRLTVPTRGHLLV